VTEPWSPETAQAPAPATWRDPAAWREDPSSAAQAAAAEAKTTAQATAAQAKATAQVTAAQVTAQAQTMLADFETRTADRPEQRVAAVFAGGVLAALILRRLAR
jgi:ElaB/YqjD/DUF883 family membrane-anchored ribosome-binding protein